MLDLRTRRTASLLIAIAATAGLAGCSRLPKNARGQTPVRYVLCDAQGHDCYVAARFENIRSCERYLRFDRAKCDDSQPGKLSCDLDSPPPTTSSCMP